MRKTEDLAGPPQRASPRLLGPIHLSRASWWQQRVAEEVGHLWEIGNKEWRGRGPSTSSKACSVTKFLQAED